MAEWQFQAIGTVWSISTLDRSLSKDDQTAITDWLQQFEQRFSRFISTSEVNQFCTAGPGEYEVSETFAYLLRVADTLRVLTGGRYDPTVGALLDRAGYNNSYTLTPDERATAAWEAPNWQLANTTLTLDGPASFDLGSIGKGYAIDQVAALLRERGHAHLLVDAGGDMFGTTKSDGTPWRVAIEYPGAPDRAAGVVTISHQALAVSDVYRRRWQQWHHLLDPQTKRPIQNVVGATAVAATALHADAMTAALCFGTPDAYTRAAAQFEAAFVVFHPDTTVTRSQTWPGELFEG